jgi:hypothetical protein
LPDQVANTSRLINGDRPTHGELPWLLSALTLLANEE